MCIRPQSGCLFGCYSRGGWVAKCPGARLQSERDGRFNVLCQPQAVAQKRNRHFAAPQQHGRRPGTHTRPGSRSQRSGDKRTRGFVLRLWAADPGTTGCSCVRLGPVPVPVPECLPQKRLNKLTRTHM